MFVVISDYYFATARFLQERVHALINGPEVPLFLCLSICGPMMLPSRVNDNKCLKVLQKTQHEEICFVCSVSFWTHSESSHASNHEYIKQRLMVKVRVIPNDSDLYSHYMVWFCPTN